MSPIDTCPDTSSKVTKSDPSVKDCESPPVLLKGVSMPSTPSPVSRVATANESANVNVPDANVIRSPFWSKLVKKGCISWGLN